MPEASPAAETPRTYRAFLSYDHDDREAAHVLHRRLERYRIDRDLVGRAGASGAVPRSLSPIFLDRADLAGGGHLGEEIRQALVDSDYLIVVCSPFAAESRYVNDEVRRFKQMGRSTRIIPYILSGEPHDPKRECFMPALKVAVAPDGSLTEEPEELLGVDARPEGDGPDLALHKVVARLIGVRLDEILRRAQVAEQRQKRIYMGVAGAMGVLALAATYAGVRAVSESRRFETLLDGSLEGGSGVVRKGVDIFAENGVPVADGQAFLGQASDVLKGFGGVVHGKDRRDKLAFSHARMQLIIAEGEGRMGRTSEQLKLASEALEGLRLVRERSVPQGALEAAMAEAHLLKGGAYRRQGKYSASLESLLQGAELVDAALARTPDDRGWLDLAVRLYDSLARVELVSGKKEAALATTDRALAVAEHWLALGPKDLEARRGREDIRLIRATILIEHGAKGFAEAEAVLEGSIKQRKVLVAEQPGDPRWPMMLSRALHELGRVHEERKSLEAARRSYIDALAAIEPVARRDTRNTELQITYVAALTGAAGMRVGPKQAEWDRAVPLLEEASATMERLIEEVDPANPQWRRRLAEIYDEVGHIRSDKKDFEGAIAIYRKSLALREGLLVNLEEDATLLGTVALSHNLIGHRLKDLKRYDEAVASYERALSYRERQMEREPASRSARRNAARSHDNIGVALREKAEALAAIGAADRDVRLAAIARFAAARDIYVKLAAEEPASADWQNGLRFESRNMAEAQEKAGLLEEALASYAASIDAARWQLANDTRASAKLEAERDLSFALARSGIIRAGQGAPLGEIAARLEESLARGRNVVDNSGSGEFTWAIWRRALAEAAPLLGNTQRKAGAPDLALKALLDGHALIAAAIGKAPGYETPILRAALAKIEATIIELGGAIPPS